MNGPLTKALILTGHLLLAALCRGGEWQAALDLREPRTSHSATLLPSGQVLLAGGQNGAALATVELFDPATGRFTRTGNLAAARYFHTATLLPSGQVLVVGGLARQHRAGRRRALRPA